MFGVQEHDNGSVGTKEELYVPMLLLKFDGGATIQLGDRSHAVASAWSGAALMWKLLRLSRRL